MPLLIARYSNDAAAPRPRMAWRARFWVSGGIHALILADIITRRTEATGLTKTGGHGSTNLWGALCLTFLALVGCVEGATEAAPNDALPLRVAFSSRLFTEINENDARAAVKAWALAVARERNIQVDPSATIATGEALTNLFLHGQVDAAGLTVDELLALRRIVAIDPIFVGIQSNRITEEFVLLVHEDAGASAVADLRTKRLLVFEAPRTCLAPAWLDVLLARDGLGSPGEFFGGITSKRKLSSVVLPVFFRTAECCLVTRRGFEMLAELNPQVGRKLRILASSPKVVTAVFCFRADYQSSIKDKVLAAIRDLHHTAGGRQVLNVFQIDRLEQHPASCLESAEGLLAEHARLAQPKAPEANTTP